MNRLSVQTDAEGCSIYVKGGGIITERRYRRVWLGIFSTIAMHRYRQMKQYLQSINQIMPPPEERGMKITRFKSRGDRSINGRNGQ